MCEHHEDLSANLLFRATHGPSPRLVVSTGSGILEISLEISEEIEADIKAVEADVLKLLKEVAG